MVHAKAGKHAARRAEDEAGTPENSASSLVACQDGLPFTEYKYFISEFKML